MMGNKKIEARDKKSKIKALSLFANIGVAEAYLEKIGVDVVIANEIDNKRAEVYKYIYPKTEMICGDIRDDKIIKDICQKSLNYEVNLVMASPPCQGMSTAGKQDKNDKRNDLICCAVEIVKKINPKYVLIENVPMQLLTKIKYKNKYILIPEYLKIELSDKYNFDGGVINIADYGVPQIRERAIFLLTRKDIHPIWKMPKKENKVVTLSDAIGHLPQLDPLIYDIDYKEHLKIFPEYEKKLSIAKSISKWHVAPRHIKRQVISMMHASTGQSAFNNKDKFKPKNKENRIVRGYKNTYKRQNWDTPAYTITMYNRTIGSQNNVHPGRYIGNDKNGEPLYSDPRVLTIYELMIAMSIPTNWNLPDNMTENFIRAVIGEGIPPLFIKKLVNQIVN